MIRATLLFFILCWSFSANASFYMEAVMDSRLNTKNATDLDKLENSTTLSLNQKITEEHRMVFTAEMSRRSLVENKNEFRVDDLSLGYSFVPDVSSGELYFNSSINFQLYTNKALQEILNINSALSYYSYIEREFSISFSLIAQAGITHYIPRDQNGWGLVDDLFFTLIPVYYYSDTLSFKLPIKHYLELYTDYESYGSYLNLAPTTTVKLSKNLSIDFYMNYLVDANQQAEFLFTNYSQGWTYGVRLNFE